MSLRQEQIYASDLREAISDYPVKLRWMATEINASFNGGRLGVDAVDGGILIDDNATIIANVADFPTPLPREGNYIEVRQRDGVTWKTYEVMGDAESNDPKGVGISIIVGPVGKR